ncbi:hypothetical protein S3E15_01374 [Bacillus mycoides]|uniref:Uncharacterized protein n=1 Tax=Bacillus mycoides TaxID=1405 RepID=A0AAP7W600_BACMY|nr:hypothetical protein [Bacillus mycoides]EJS00295.1 hypothetical protein IKM_04474 [Bacillus mycoides]MED0886513.1 hypothetical protein [Bacillus mycoides]MED0928189.1 hypothetical protein [Bacillus mycoides]MED0943808.1 hypothetical protein [Bacillus mycoides]OSX91008.1 hypothetical protein S3E15_01374 [Bacillus mycoides]
MFDKLKDTVENNVEAMDQLYEKFIRQIENTPIIGQYHNYKKGKNEAVLDEPKGILNTILHPIDSVEGEVKIPLPFIDDWKLVVGGDVAYGSIGGEAKVGLKSELSVGLGPVGLGIKFGVEK